MRGTQKERQRESEADTQRWKKTQESRLEVTWEFPKIGDPNIVPQIVGSLL